MKTILKIAALGCIGFSFGCDHGGSPPVIGQQEIQGRWVVTKVSGYGMSSDADSAGILDFKERSPGKVRFIVKVEDGHLQVTKQDSDKTSNYSDYKYAFGRNHLQIIEYYEDISDVKFEGDVTSLGNDQYQLALSSGAATVTLKRISQEQYDDYYNSGFTKKQAGKESLSYTLNVGSAEPVQIGYNEFYPGRVQCDFQDKELHVKWSDSGNSGESAELVTNYLPFSDQTKSHETYDVKFHSEANIKGVLIPVDRAKQDTQCYCYYKLDGHDIQGTFHCEGLAGLYQGQGYRASVLGHFACSTP